MRRFLALALLTLALAAGAQQVFVNDNGTLREIDQIFVNDNGTLRELEEVVVNDNGTLRQVFSAANPTPQLSNSSITKNVGPQFDSCEWELQRDGDFIVDSVVRTNEWLLSGDKSSTIGDLYEVRITKTGGGLTLAGITNGAWTALSTTSRTVNTGSTVPNTWTGTIEIRETLVTSNIDSATMSCTLN